MNLRYAMIPGKDICYAVGSVGSVITQSTQNDPNVKDRIKKTEELQEYLSNKVRGFYQKLERSILCEGFRNPVLITAGEPLRYRHLIKQFENLLGSNKREWLIAEYLAGGSRIYIAQKHNLNIPCIVKDQVGRFSDCPLIRTERQMLSYFKDRPAKINFNLSYGGNVLWNDLPGVIAPEADKICFTTLEDLQKVEELTRIVRGDKWDVLTTKAGFWGHCDSDLLKLHYPTVYRNLQEFYANGPAKKHAKNRPDPDLIQRRREYAQRVQREQHRPNPELIQQRREQAQRAQERRRLEAIRLQQEHQKNQEKQRLVAQENAKRPAVADPNKFIRFPRNTFP